MTNKSSKFIIFGVAGFVSSLIILAVVSVIVYLFATKKKEETPAPEPEPAPEPAQQTRAAVVEECPQSEPTPKTTCPYSPYTYCSTDSIKNVYVISGCGPSTNLLTKLTREGKISGVNDPKVIYCCKNPDVCTEAGIRSYPSVICENTPSDIYQGYCE